MVPSLANATWCTFPLPMGGPVTLDIRPPIPPGESWGDGKRTSESIEQTGSDSSYLHP